MQVSAFAVCVSHFTCTYMCNIQPPRTRLFGIHIWICVWSRLLIEWWRDLVCTLLSTELTHTAATNSYRFLCFSFVDSFCVFASVVTLWKDTGECSVLLRAMYEGCVHLSSLLTSAAHFFLLYRQTESTAASTLTNPGDNRTIGCVGTPLCTNLVKLVDVPEMNYTGKDVVNGAPCPRGEVCFKGGNVFSGYYLDPEKTAEAIDADGWLHSGDIGMWLPSQELKLIDRKKNM